MPTPDAAPAPDVHGLSVRRSLTSASVVMGLFAVAGGLLLLAGSRSGATALHAQLEFFAAFTGLSVFFLASAKYLVSRERVYLPLALGLLAASFLDLAHPALDALLASPAAAGGAFALPGDPDYLWVVNRLAFGAAFVAAALAFRQGSVDGRPGVRLTSTAAATLAAALASVPILLVLDLPPYPVAGSPATVLLELAPVGLYATAAVLLVRTRRPSGQGIRVVGTTSLALAAVVQGFAVASRTPFDGLYFAAHITKVGTYLVVLFGLYLEHVRLYSLERGLRESLETAHLDLKSAKMELDAIIEDLTDGVVVADEAGRIVRFNRAAREILGQEVIGVPPDAYTRTFRVETAEGQPFPVEDYPIVRALRTGEAARGAEFVVHRPSGERRSIVAGAIPIRDSRGRVRGAVAAFSDVTEIRSAEQRFRDLTESAPDGIIVIDDRWRIILFNRAAERLYGYRRDELYGQDVSVLIPDRLKPSQRAAREEHERQGGPLATEGPVDFRGLRKDGTEVAVEVSMSSSRTAGGQFYIAHVRDATGRERLRREREGILSVALAATATTSVEEFLQRAAQAITKATEFDACAVYLHDPARHALVLRAHDHVPDEVRERIQHYPLDPKFPAVAVQTWFERRVLTEARLADRQDLHVTSSLVEKYGYRSLVSAPIGTEPEPLGVLQVVATVGLHAGEEDAQLIQLLAQELTNGLRQKRLIQQLEEGGAQLRAANQELDSFIYTASHDLAEPLRSISNFSHFLLEDYAPRLDDEGKDYLQRVHGGALRMKRLLDDLLRLSRLGRSRAPRTRVQVADVLDEVRESLDATLRERGAVVEAEGELPAVVADRTSLVEVFANLVGNGIKFNQSPTPRVRVRAARRNGMVEFSVEDNGIGIPDEQRERIFGLFTRLHNRKEYPGTGAGLAIVRRIVENHGGRIWVESAPGSGSAFLFTLPGAPAPVARLEVPKPGAPVP